MADISAEVANALHWSLTIPRHKVMAEVNGGVVTLRGVVDRAYQKSCAEAIARCVPGVVEVRNNIAIRSSLEFSLTTFQP
jgi:osmotically-inducible protein OsmY